MRTAQEVLVQSKTIAVVGLSPKPERDSHGVAKYLQEQGYRIIPVNPAVTEVLGEKSYASLTDIPVHVDLVDVFRRSEEVLPVANEAVAIDATAFWMQDGVINEEAERVARDAGLDVIMDDCTMRQHVRLKRAGSR